MVKTAFPRVIGLWAAGLGAAAQFGKMAVGFPYLSETYGSGVAVGFIVSLVGLVGVVFGVTAGLLVASVGFRRALVGALLLGAVMSAYQASLPPIGLMLASRALEGVSHLAIVVAAPTLIAQLSAARHRGLTLSLWSTFFGVAFAALVWLGDPLAQRYGIGAVLFAHATYMAAMAVVVAVMLPRDPPAPHVALSFGGLLRDHVTIYQSPFLNAPALGWVCYAGAFVAILTIMPSFLPETIRASVIGAMPLVGIACSMTLGVWLLRRGSAVAIIQTGFLLSLVLSGVLWVWPTSALPYLALALALGLVQGASFAAIAQLNPDPSAQAKANGALAQMGNIGTTCGTPLLAALVAAWQITGFAIFAVVLFSAGAALHAWMAHRRAACG
ncbi:MAG: MFS transporter [Sedimentitalea sp.]